MEIHITENKSPAGTLGRPGHCVRVFIDRDYNYGLFVEEARLFARLNADQREQYLATDGEIKFTVDEDVGREIVKIGFSPFKTTTELPSL